MSVKGRALTPEHRAKMREAALRRYSDPAERQRQSERRRASSHGQVGTGTYGSWSAMLQRCTNPRNKEYPNYGGRGVRVCDLWRQFENFLADMGPRPPGLTLDRINTDGHYEPGNCRWATASEQASNRRPVPSKLSREQQEWVLENAHRLSLSALGRELGVAGTTVKRVIRLGVLAR